MTFTETTTMNGGPDFEVAVIPDLGALAPVRREVAGRLTAHGVAIATVDDVLLVVDELCSNAIQATAAGDGPILVRVGHGDASVVIDVENTGPSFDAPAEIAERHTEVDSEGGRGLAIVRALTDEVVIRFSEGRCTVRAVIALT